MMKPLFTIILLCGLAGAATVAPDNYRSNLTRSHERLEALDMERGDYRRPSPELSPELEKERFQLIGQLTEENPLWALTRDLEADTEAMVADGKLGEGDVEVLEQMKDLQAVVVGVLEAPASRAESKEYARALRRFVVHQDVAGARQWVRQHTK